MGDRLGDTASSVRRRDLRNITEPSQRMLARFARFARTTARSLKWGRLLSGQPGKLLDGGKAHSAGELFMPAKPIWLHSIAAGLNCNNASLHKY
jgi:hypothetical protein